MYFDDKMDNFHVKISNILVNWAFSLFDILVNKILLRFGLLFTQKKQFKDNTWTIQDIIMLLINHLIKEIIWLILNSSLKNSNISGLTNSSVSPTCV